MTSERKKPGETEVDSNLATNKTGVMEGDIEKAKVILSISLIPGAYTSQERDLIVRLAAGLAAERQSVLDSKEVRQVVEALEIYEGCFKKCRCQVDGWPHLPAHFALANFRKAAGRVSEEI